MLDRPCLKVEETVCAECAGDCDFHRWDFCGEMIDAVSKWRRFQCYWARYIGGVAPLLEDDQR